MIMCSLATIWLFFEDNTTFIKSFTLLKYKTSLKPLNMPVKDIYNAIWIFQMTRLQLLLLRALSVHFVPIWNIL